MTMLSRRDFLQVASAAVALSGGGGRLAAQAARQAVTQDDLLRFTPKGQVTLLHMADCHAQLMPLYFREPSVNIGAGEAKGLPPHLTGDEFLRAFNVPPGSGAAYALSSKDFETLARTYGRVGGMDRMATLINAIRSERGAERTLLLDGGDTLQGSYTALQSKGADMMRVMEQLGVEATTGHWEFTLGQERIAELFGTRDNPVASKIAFLAGNVRDNEMDEPIFRATKVFEKGGVKIAVIGQAFPFTPIANPRWMMASWVFGIRENDIRRRVAAARAAGAEIVVLLSHNGFDVDRKLASRVDGIDIILTSHTHDALPEPVRVKGTILIASGSATKFLSRLDIEVKNGRMVDFSYALIPVLSDAITPDPGMAAIIRGIRAPHEAMLATELARTQGLLYRRGNFNGTFDDVVCDAMLSERNAEICFSPGFRWGNSLLPDQAITWDDLYSATAITYPNCYRRTLSGAAIKDILEDVADNLFNPDPYYQQGGDMVRVGGMRYAIDIDAPMGRRITAMTSLRTGETIDASRDYAVAGWASVADTIDGPPIWDVVAAHLKAKKVVGGSHADTVRMSRTGG
jgi:S-sulfosulfanyl-L-cysteine sulfohydrolase